MKLYSLQTLTLDKWQFLSMTYNGAKLTIYIDSVQIAFDSSYTYQMPSINRTNNLIGKSNMGGSDCFSWSYIDDLRFYNTSLNSSQLDEIMNLNTSLCNFESI